jgi:hypothetical protein
MVSLIISVPWGKNLLLPGGKVNSYEESSREHFSIFRIENSKLSSDWRIRRNGLG